MPTPRLTDIFICAACTHPFIHLGELELPQPPHAVCGQTLALAPAVHGVLGHAQVLGDVIGAGTFLVALVCTVAIAPIVIALSATLKAG